MKLSEQTKRMDTFFLFLHMKLLGDNMLVRACCTGSRQRKRGQGVSISSVSGLHSLLTYQRNCYVGVFGDNSGVIFLIST